MSKFTPGPWEFNRNRIEMCEKSTDIVSFQGSDICEPIARIPHDDITSEGAVEVIANMHLIATAVDMYHFINMLPGTPETIAILAKARGES